MEPDKRYTQCEQVTVSKTFNAEHRKASPRPPRPQQEHESTDGKWGEHEICDAPAARREMRGNEPDAQVPRNCSEKQVAKRGNNRVGRLPKRLGEYVKAEIGKYFEQDLQQELADDFKDCFEHQ